MPNADSSARATDAPEVLMHADRLIECSVAWDNHGCMPLGTDHKLLPQLDRYRAAGFDVVSLNIGFGTETRSRNLQVITAFRDWLDAHADRFLIVDTASDIARSRAEGRLAVTFDLEGTGGFDDQLSAVERYYDLGVRWTSIAYNQNNSVGGGCQDEDAGLTTFGREMVAEMNRVGMVVCCSHTGYRTALEVAAHSTRPVIVSHSNPRALVDHPRNVPDEVMQAVAATGGVVGINGVGLFLGDLRAGSASIADHVEYAIGLIGEDHVGLGFDYVFDEDELNQWIRHRPDLFPPEKGYSEGLRIARPEQLREIVAALVARGHSDARLAKVLGGNWMRVAEGAWRPHRAGEKGDAA